MNRKSSILYVPALRLKQGEYNGLMRLAPDVADLILPRLVVPPPKERDPEFNRPLTKEEIVYVTGRRIGKYWPLREAFLETRFLFKEFGEADCGIWLPHMFEVARDAGAKVIPIATLSDAVGSRGDAFRQTLSDGGISRIALRIESGEINRELINRVAAALSSLGVSAVDCTVLADFADADFSNSEAVSEIAQAAFEDLQSVGTWRQIVFQGTNYPEVNPAKEDGEVTVSRNEWLAWKKAVQFNASSSEELVFGDYCADCGRFEFRTKGGGKPIRHYRYTTTDSWLVVRGKETGRAEEAMINVCQKIVDSGRFAGRQFSSADDYIYMSAKGWVGPGNGTTWREINTAHHITRVVRDIGTIKGKTFADVSVADPPRQMTLLADLISDS